MGNLMDINLFVIQKQLVSLRQQVESINKDNQVVGEGVSYLFVMLLAISSFTLMCGLVL